MNSQAFTPEEVAKGLHLKFIGHLLEISNEMEKCYFDIHITSDGYCTIVEWVDVLYDERECEDRFEFVKYNQVIMQELDFPDRHTEYCFPEEADERIAEWHREHPEWVKTSYGTWTNEKENEEFRKAWEKVQSDPQTSTNSDLAGTGDAIAVNKGD